MLIHTRVVLPLLAIAVIGCGATDPDVRHPEWEDSFNRSLGAASSGDHDQAIKIAEQYLAEHPDNVDGLLMVASASADAAEARSDQRRPELFAQAATHYTRVLELSKNPNSRLLALVGAVRAYSPTGLDKPDEREKYARILVEEDPSNITSYLTLVQVLRDNKKFDEVTTVIEQSQSAMTRDEEGVRKYGTMVHDLVVFTPGFPQDSGRRLLSGASEMTDQAFSAHGRTEGLLFTKTVLLRALADLEPDAARKSELSEQYQKTSDELDRLQK